MNLPKDVEFILNSLNNSGYEAYVVGGGVRDHLMGLQPNDYDITTSATPEEVIKVFNEYIFINENGLKHGTVTLRLNKENYEITTFRVEGLYLDARRPSSVEFTRSLKEDLKRRDFTVNAIAYNNEKGFVDYYGGIEDIKNKVLKAVNNPIERFNEDALRILRCLRFSSKLNFNIEENTKEAMYACSNKLSLISMERVRVELDGILLGDNCLNVLDEHREIISLFIPEIKPMFNFSQNNPYHKHDVYMHSINVVANIDKDSTLKLAGLLHDIGKPKCYTEEIKNGQIIGHFYNHATISLDLSIPILKRLKYSNEEINKIEFLVLYHDYNINPTTKSVKKFLNKVSNYNLDNNIINDLFKLQEADMKDHLIKDKNYNSNKKEVLKIIEAILLNNDCFNLSNLNLNGNDLINAGYNGIVIGVILSEVLQLVINEELVNDKTILLNYITNKYDKASM